MSDEREKMRTDIEYCDEIIVLVKYNDRYTYYISEKEDWLLEYELGQTNTIEGESKISSFLEAMKKYIVNLDLLKSFVLKYAPNEIISEVIHYFPSLLIDFDEKVLYSSFYELTTFEREVPSDWEGLFCNFYEKIPDAFKYWIINERDYYLEAENLAVVTRQL